MRFRPLGRRARALLSLALIATLVLLGTMLAVDRFGQQERARAAPMIVVLGARVLAGGAPSNPLRARVEKAVALYRRGLAPRLLFSGGLGEHGPAEAVVARALAVELGVPAESCLIEDQSHNTAENARFSAKLLRQEGIREVILVSEPYHLLRAQQYFHREEIAAHPSPALDSERNVRLYARVRWTLRDAVALLVHPELFFARRPEPTTNP